MSDTPGWQRSLLDDLSIALRAEQDVQALILTGSLAYDNSAPDEWSDIDLTAIVSDGAIDAFFSQRAWLERHGNLLGLERHSSPDGKTLRVCFAPCRRVDITLVPESLLGILVTGGAAAACRAHVLLWSKIQEAGLGLPGMFREPQFDGVSAEGVGEIADAFWYKAAIAIAKIMRSDLLVGLHLALDLSRDCLVLQMHRRDRLKGTSIHRYGGGGNDIVARLLPQSYCASPVGILELIRHSIHVFDELAVEALPAYVPRADLLIPALRNAELACGHENGASE